MIHIIELAVLTFFINLYKKKCKKVLVALDLWKEQPKCVGV